jgi:transcriptional regulator with XRE-family HTH domain
MSENITHRIGENIKALRETGSLSQEDLAQRMNMARPGISNWENGKSEPSSSQLVQLSKIFNISLDMLVGNSHESLTVAVVDTSVLMKRPVLIDELIQKFDEVIVSDIVVSELNNLKDGNNNRKKQRAWLAMVNLQKRIDDKSVKYAVSTKKDGKNDERIMAVALARAQESFTDKVYMFSDDVWFSFLVKEQKQSNIESLTFVIYDEQFKDTTNYDPIKTQNFFSLVKSKKLNEAKKFDLQSVDINKVDAESGFTPLIQAVRNRDLEMVQFLCSLPMIDLNVRDSQKYRFTGLLHASQLKDSTFKILKSLVENGADIDAGSLGENAGNTPLMVCAWGGYTQGVEYLLEQGACLNQQDSNGFTALIKSCIQSQYEIAKLLIKQTDLNIRSRKNMKAVEYIKPNSRFSQQFFKLFKDNEKNEVIHD